MNTCETLTPSQPLTANNHPTATVTAPNPLPPGTYRLTARSTDSAHTDGYQPHQTQEQWTTSLTPTSPDLPDAQQSAAYDYGTITLPTALTALTFQHTAPPAAGAQSVTPSLTFCAVHPAQPDAAPAPAPAAEPQPVTATEPVCLLRTADGLEVEVTGVNTAVCETLPPASPPATPPPQELAATGAGSILLLAAVAAAAIFLGTLALFAGGRTREAGDLTDQL